MVEYVYAAASVAPPGTYVSLELIPKPAGTGGEGAGFSIIAGTKLTVSYPGIGFGPMMPPLDSHVARRFCRTKMFLRRRKKTTRAMRMTRIAITTPTIAPVESPDDEFDKAPFACPGVPVPVAAPVPEVLDTTLATGFAPPVLLEVVTGPDEELGVATIKLDDVVEGRMTGELEEIWPTKEVVRGVVVGWGIVVEGGTKTVMVIGPVKLKPPVVPEPAETWRWAM